METRTDEIADRIYRISTFIPEIAPPAGFTFNQFLIDAEEPLLYHTGQKQLFPLVSEAVAKVVPLERLRWIAFSHFEADECGAMNDFLAAAPRAELAGNAVGCILSLEDQAIRPPFGMRDGDVLDIGGKILRRRVRNIDTPHVPHTWEARTVYEEETGTLFCGDLLTHVGRGQPAVTNDDLVGAAVEAETMFRFTSCLTATATTLRSLADLSPTTLAVMHGSSYNGDCAGALKTLADEFEARFSEPGLVASRGVLPDVPLGAHPG